MAYPSHFVYVRYFGAHGTPFCSPHLKVAKMPVYADIGASGMSGQMFSMCCCLYASRIHSGFMNCCISCSRPPAVAIA